MKKSHFIKILFLFWHRYLLSTTLLSRPEGHTLSMKCILFMQYNIYWFKHLYCSMIPRLPKYFHFAVCILVHLGSQRRAWLRNETDERINHSHETTLFNSYICLTHESWVPGEDGIRQSHWSLIQTPNLLMSCATYTTYSYTAYCVADLDTL